MDILKYLYSRVWSPGTEEPLHHISGGGQGDLLTCNISLRLLQMVLSFQEHVALRSLDI